MKACEVFKTKKEYKIVTGYQVDVGRYVMRPPVSVFPIDINIKEFKDFIFQSLNDSKPISYDEYYSGISPRDVLKQMKESSFPGLYKKSTSCMVYLDNEKIKIVPYRYNGPESGLNEVANDIKIIDFKTTDEIQITIEIEKILNKNYE